MSDQPQTIVYTSSVKISQNAKGSAQVDVHIFGTDDSDTMTRAVLLYTKTIESLKAKQIAVAAEVNGK